MTLLNIADMLSDILELQDVYAGTIDGNLDKCVGVYNAKTSKPQRICIGGKACTKTLEKHMKNISRCLFIGLMLPRRQR